MNIKDAISNATEEQRATDTTYEMSVTCMRKYADFTCTGTLVHARMLGQSRLLLRREHHPDVVLSTHEPLNGLINDVGCVFIPDWAECEGLAQALMAHGVAEHVRTFKVGVFVAPVHELSLRF